MLFLSVSPGPVALSKIQCSYPLFLAEETLYLVGAITDPAASRFDFTWGTLESGAWFLAPGGRVANQASYFLTQPLYNPDLLISFTSCEGILDSLYLLLEGPTWCMR